MYVLNPVSSLSDQETNDASVVLLIEHEDIQFLFPGDIDSSIEATVIARQTPIAAEILKVAHHGSSYSSSDSFLATVQPLEAIISVGNNSYGHPAQETIDRLIAAGARIWRTDEDGSIFVTTDGYGYTITSENAVKLLLIPVVFNNKLPTPTATGTPTPTATATSTSTPTPTSTPNPPGTTGDFQILDIFYDGAGSQEPDEYVVIKNVDSQPIQLHDWTLRDIANHVYTFPSFVIEVNQTCRVYTNEFHSEWCNFNYENGAAIWNNTGDCAYLRDSTGTEVDEYCY